jgi:hypothetical protein
MLLAFGGKLGGGAVDCRRVPAPLPRLAELRPPRRAYCVGWLLLVATVINWLFI